MQQTIHVNANNAALLSFNCYY